MPLPLRSTLIQADLVAERFVGLYPITDWTGEVGVRRQLTPKVVLDLGVARHFTLGVVQIFRSHLWLVTYVLAAR